MLAKTKMGITRALTNIVRRIGLGYNENKVRGIGLVSCAETVFSSFFRGEMIQIPLKRATIGQPAMA